MNQAAHERRIRTLAAMGLGPSWVRRSLPVSIDEAAIPVVARPGQAPSIERTARIGGLDWVPLQEEVAVCVACDLAATRTRTVFGIGAARPEWLVIGEAPGIDEDRQGEPFVGQAGKLLDAMLAAVGLSRDRDVFIANVLKCRLPGDRDPSRVEIESCRPFLERQIALLRPRLILVVGDVATAALLGAGETMANSRGRAYRVAIDGRETPVIATYHPARLLVTPEEKARAWEDLCLARTLYQTLPATQT